MSKKPIRKKLAVGGTLLVVLVVAVAAVLLSQGSDEPAVDVPVNHISDESLGLSFDMSKDFTQLSRAELVQKNPSFVYGFRPADTPDTGCFVAKTPRPQGGKVKAGYVIQGTMAAIKKGFPSAKLQGSRLVKVEEGYTGILMDVTYVERKQTVRRAELVIPTEQDTFFAFCDSPQNSLVSYQERFTAFFSSLKLQPGT